MAAEVPVEVITEEGLSGRHIFFHLVRFHLIRPSLELHLTFLHRVKSRVKSMQKTLVCDLNIYIETSHVTKKIKNTSFARGKVETD